MASTVPSMLKVLYNRKIGTVVMLSALEENGQVRVSTGSSISQVTFSCHLQESCFRYWPKLNQVTTIGDFEVDLISEEVLSGFTIRNISILHQKVQLYIQMYACTYALSANARLANRSYNCLVEHLLSCVHIHCSA